MPADHTAAYESLCNHTRETAKLASIMGLLEWDERTKMPPAGGDYRVVLHVPDRDIARVRTVMNQKANAK